MEKIVWNGSQINLDIDDSDKVKDLVEQLREKSKIEQNIITSLTIDDQEYYEKSKERLNNKRVAEIQIVNVKTENRYSLVQRSLNSMTDYLPNLVRGMGKIADEYRLGESSETNTKLIDAIDGMKNFIDLLIGVEYIYEMKLSEMTIRKINMGTHLTNLIQQLESLYQAMNQGDGVLIADLLDYEMTPIYKDWIEILPELRKKIKEDSVEDSIHASHSNERAA